MRRTGHKTQSMIRRILRFEERGIVSMAVGVFIFGCSLVNCRDSARWRILRREKMPKVEFFYFADCPSHERALALLREVMAEEQIQAPVEIVEVKTEAEAEQY